VYCPIEPNVILNVAKRSEGSPLKLRPDSSLAYRLTQNDTIPAVGPKPIRQNFRLAVCLAIIGVALTGCADEKAKWNFARAMNLSDSGQLEESIALMQTAMEQLPNESQIKLNLANLLAENGQGEMGIGLCEDHLEENPNDIAARQIRSTCLQYLGRFDESLQQYKECLSGRVSRNETERNNLAYFRALAEKELSKAADDIQIAIEQEEGKNWGSPFRVPLQVRAVIAAGLISRRIDGRQDALKTLDRKINQYEARMALQNALIKILIAEKIRIEFPLGEKSENETLNARANLEVQKNCLALMLATRALIHEDLESTRRADADRRRINALGFEFNELARALPSDGDCLAGLELSSLYLDTRGFVSGRRAWKGDTEIVEQEPNLVAMSGPGSRPSSYREALEDLDFAVLAAQTSQQALDSPLYNSPEFTAQHVAQLKKMARRMTAVLLYHRMEIHQRGGNSAAAEEDQRRIAELGFQPGSSLF
jgi:tetratricopeptide (TPR) repeat protein